MTAPLPRVRHRRPALRWRHRIPVRLRHHWRPVALLAVFLAAVMGVFGTARVLPYITGDDLYEAPEVTEDIAGTVALFDSGTAHTVRLTFAQDDYERTLQAWYDEGEKEYLEADLEIDGTVIENVGVRLKGNSTLMGLRDPNADQTAGARGQGGFQPPDGFQPPEGFQLPEGLPLPEGVAPPAGEGQPAGGGAGGQGGPEMGGGFSSVTLSAEEPENLPWLISFDEFAEGRRYQGHSEIAVRPASSSSTFAANEALALSLVAETGQTSQAFSYSTFSVNDRPTTTRLLVEHPDENYAETAFDTDGVLYKSLAGGSFTDQGDDPTDYVDDFEQVNRIGSQDLQPVIDLIQWVATATDEEFATGLADRLDIDSFARYLATHNLLLNFDDMAGPGRNYYLRYDLESEKFEVITWDLNLTFSGAADTGPRDEIGFGGIGGGGGSGAPGGATAAQPDGQGVPGTPPEGAAGAPTEGGRGGLGGNQLKERFLANPAFTDVYEQAYRDLYQQMFAGGGALQVLDQLAASVPTSDSLDAATITADLDTLRQTVTARTTALAADPVVTGTQ